jgi:hypothetical protein
VVAVVPTWTGCYIGGGGYGLWNQENTGFLDPGTFGKRIPITSRTQVTDTVTAGGHGYFGTVQGGCDYQFAGLGQQFVIGAFGDYDFSSLKGRLFHPNFNVVGDEKMSSAWAVGAASAGWHSRVC